MALPLVAIVGAPNVGKSTLFNRLIGGRRSIVTDEPGVTRDRLYGEVREAPCPFRLVDTGGLALRMGSPFAHAIEAQAMAALEQASLILLVVDARAGLTALDREIAALLRRWEAGLLLVANKVDTPSLEPMAYEFFPLGIGRPLPVSAEHGLGIEDLLERVCERLERPATGITFEEAPSAVRVAIVGRPNVGKSSLLNRLLGEERVMVSEVPGTTRDAVDTMLERDGWRFLLVDTAGIRRKGRLRGRAESLSVVVARKSIGRADVVVLVLDAADGLVAQDTHIAGYAAEAWKPVVLVVNKWDLAHERQDAAVFWEEEIRRRLPFIKNPVIVLASAKTGQRVVRILERVKEVHESAGIRVSTPELNRWLERVARRERASPAAGGAVHILYATQTGTRPPRFLLFCNHPRRVHFSLRRFLENSLREQFGFGSAPIRLQFRRRPPGKAR